MLMVSEQQTFTKLRIAPADFAQMCLDNPDQALEYIKTLQGEREQVKERKKKEPKDPNAPRKSRKTAAGPPDLSKFT